MGSHPASSCGSLPLQRHAHTVPAFMFMVVLATWIWILPFAAAWSFSPDLYSSHVCYGEDRGNRTCILNNIYIWQGELYYVAMDPRLKVPLVDMVWHVEPTHTYARNLPLHVVGAEDVPFEMMRDLPIDTPLSVLWYRLDLINNFSHMVAETSFSIHKLMCEFLDLCEYGQVEAENFHLVFIDPKPPFPLASIQEAYRCFSDFDPVLFSEIKEDSRARRLIKTVAGIGPECRAFHYCMGAERLAGARERMKPDMLESWRNRMLTCVGADPLKRAGSLQPRPQTSMYNKQLVAINNEVRLVDNPVQKPIVLVVNRMHSFARSFRNLKDILPLLAQGLPQYEVKAAYVENLSFATQVHLFNSASIVVMTHGGVFGNVPFMPHGATVIEVMPNGDVCTDFHEFYADGLVQDIATVTNITLVEFDINRRERNFLRMDILSKDPWFQELTEQEKLQLLESTKCPEEGPNWSDYPFRRQRCMVNWLLKATDVELDAEMLIQRILEINVPGVHTQSS